MQLRNFLNIGILDANESPRTKWVGKFFDFIMLLVMFWLPLQWYSEYKGILSQDFLNTANWIIWALFLTEFAVMLALVKKKSVYLQSSWLNILIIIAIFPPLFNQNTTYVALVRYLRIIILVRLLLPQIYIINRLLSRHSFGLSLIIFLLATILSGLLITYLDPSMGNIGDGLWWALQTVTTVGYGDIIPNTFAGRVFASVLMLVGVSLFSIVSANLAAYFIERGHRQALKKPEKKTQQNIRSVQDQLTHLEDRVREINEKIDRLIEEKSKK